MIEVVVPDGVAYAFVEGQPEPVRAAVRAVTGRDSALLRPGGFMTVGFTQPDQNQVVPIIVTISPVGVLVTLLEEIAGNSDSLFGVLATLGHCTAAPVPGPLDIAPTVGSLIDSARALLACAQDLLTDPEAVATLATEHIAGITGRSTVQVLANPATAARVDRLAGTLRLLGAAIATVAIGSDIIDTVADLYAQTATSGINSMSPLLGLRGRTQGSAAMAPCTEAAFEPLLPPGIDMTGPEDIYECDGRWAVVLAGDENVSGS